MNSATTTSMARTTNWMGLLVAGVAIFAIGRIGLVVLGLFFPGYKGSEFSPYSFNSREFEIGRWLGKTVVHPAKLACPQEISKHLTNATRSAGLERWDLIECSRGIQAADKFEASILIDVFERLDSKNDPFWKEWSKKHPALAAILWPAVQQLAIRHAYFALPELIQFAATTPSPRELKNAISKISLRAGLDQGHHQLAEKEYNDARITVEWAKAFGESSEFADLEKSIRAGLGSTEK